MPARPVIGIVGSRGAYGSWLRRFFTERMELPCIGHDPAGDTTITPVDLIEHADVLIFSVPIRYTPSLIDEYVALARGRERGRLWMDLTSTKAAPVRALLRSHAEVVGLHPMSAPPKTATLKGRTMAVCTARVDAWRDWLERFLAVSEAACVAIDPESHDRAMALVQGLVHAGHMAQATVLRELASQAGGLDAIAPLHTVGYELDLTVTRRILAGNATIYEDIQFENPHVRPVLERLAAAIGLLRDCVDRGDETARASMREHLLRANADFFGAAALDEGSYGFERLGYLLADLGERRVLSVFLPEDRAGSLRALLAVFEAHGLNLASIHSSRSPDGELHFRIGLDSCPYTALETACAEIEDSGIGRILARPLRVNA